MKLEMRRTWFKQAYCIHWTVADLEFPRRWGEGGGAPTPNVGTPTYYLVKCFLKTAWKWNKLDPGGASLEPPLDPPLLNVECERIVQRHYLLVTCGSTDVVCLKFLGIGGNEKGFHHPRTGLGDWMGEGIQQRATRVKFLTPWYFSC